MISVGQVFENPIFVFCDIKYDDANSTTNTITISTRKLTSNFDNLYVWSSGTLFSVFWIALSNARTRAGSTRYIDTRLRKTPFDRTSPISRPILKSIKASISIQRIVVIELPRIVGVASARARVIAATFSGKSLLVWR